MATPRSVRFEPGVLERLNSHASRHPGTSASATAARLVDEGLRMDEHPGVVFREGPSGRRAVLIGGPDVWEIIREVRATRAGDGSRTETEVLDLVSENAGVGRDAIATALAYRGAYPHEVDAFVDEAARVEVESLAAYERTRQLLSS